MHEEVSRAIEVTFVLAIEFFHLPLRAKYASKLDFGCGFRPTGIEYSQSPDQPDAIESFTACMKTVTSATSLPVKAAALHYQMISTTLHL